MTTPEAAVNGNGRLRAYPRITGWGKYLPPRVMTNRDLEQLVNTSDEWIVARTGIRERRIAAEDETASTMGIQAAQQALQAAHCTPDDVELVIAATCTPDQIFPACAALIQHGIGAQHAAAFDVNAACSGFVYALATAYQFVAAGMYRTVLVVGTDVFSRILDWSDRNTCVLFGDGAGAVVVQADSQPTGDYGFALGNDGRGAGLLYVPGFASSPAACGQHFVTMNGREVYKFALNIVASSVRQAAANAGIPIQAIDLFIPHQANERIIVGASKALGLSEDQVFMNVDRYGNTSAASVPIALCEAVETGRLTDGNRVALVGFGGGLSWAAMVLEWSPVLARVDQARYHVANNGGQSEAAETVRMVDGRRP